MLCVSFRRFLDSYFGNLKIARRTHSCVNLVMSFFTGMFTEAIPSWTEFAFLDGCMVFFPVLTYIYVVKSFYS